jgi:hypothetical protein
MASVRVPSTALIEWRCDCGSVLGFAERTSFTIQERAWGRRPHGRRFHWAEDDASMRTDGVESVCAKGHGRLLLGDDFDLPPAGVLTRRKVIVSRSLRDHAQEAE